MCVLLGVFLNLRSIPIMTKCIKIFEKEGRNRKEVGIAIKGKEISSQFESVRISYVAIMHQLVTICSTI